MVQTTIHGASRLKRIKISLSRVEAVDEKDMTGRTVRLLFLEGCAKAVAAGITVRSEKKTRELSVAPASRSGQTKVEEVARSWGCCRTVASIPGVKTNLTPLL